MQSQRSRSIVKIIIPVQSFKLEKLSIDLHRFLAAKLRHIEYNQWNILIILKRAAISEWYRASAL